MSENDLKLYDIPRGSLVQVDSDDGAPYMIKFHRLDGMYSYCTVEEGEVEDVGKVVHLSAVTPLKKVDDHYEIDHSRV